LESAIMPETLAFRMLMGTPRRPPLFEAFGLVRGWR
jgi:hypothetical protein